MSRFKSLKANPRRSLAALATVLVAVGVTGASGADFNAQTANPANTFTAGSLSMTNNKAGAILTATNLRPGVAGLKGEVDITNTGTLAAPFTLAKGTVVDNDATYKMSTKLNLVINDCGTDLDCSLGGAPSLVYSGTIAAMGTVALGTFNGSQGHRYEFIPTLDATADNNFQSKSSTVQFLWSTTS